jgi:hypothetical protein
VNYATVWSGFLTVYIVAGEEEEDADADANTGITGPDGSYLTEFPVCEGYEIHDTSDKLDFYSSLVMPALIRNNVRTMVRVLWTHTVEQRP